MAINDSWVPGQPNPLPAPPRQVPIRTDRIRTTSGAHSTSRGARRHISSPIPRPLEPPPDHRHVTLEESAAMFIRLWHDIRHQLREIDETRGELSFPEQFIAGVQLMVNAGLHLSDAFPREDNDYRRIFETRYVPIFHTGAPIEINRATFHDFYDIIEQLGRRGHHLAHMVFPPGNIPPHLPRPTNSQSPQMRSRRVGFASPPDAPAADPDGQGSRSPRHSSPQHSRTTSPEPPESLPTGPDGTSGSNQPSRRGSRSPHHSPSQQQQRTSAQDPTAQDPTNMNSGEPGNTPPATNEPPSGSGNRSPHYSPVQVNGNDDSRGSHPNTHNQSGSGNMDSGNRSPPPAQHSSDPLSTRVNAPTPQHAAPEPPQNSSRSSSQSSNTLCPGCASHYPLHSSMVPPTPAWSIGTSSSARCFLQPAFPSPFVPPVPPLVAPHVVHPMYPAPPPPPPPPPPPASGTLRWPAVPVWPVAPTPIVPVVPITPVLPLDAWEPGTFPVSPLGSALPFRVHPHLLYNPVDPATPVLQWDIVHCAEQARVLTGRGLVKRPELNDDAVVTIPISEVGHTHPGETGKINKIWIVSETPILTWWMQRWGPIVIDHSKDNRRITVRDVLDAIQIYLATPLTEGDYKRATETQSSTNVTRSNGIRLRDARRMRAANGCELRSVVLKGRALEDGWTRRSLGTFYGESPVYRRSDVLGIVRRFLGLRPVVYSDGSWKLVLGVGPGPVPKFF